MSKIQPTISVVAPALGNADPDKLSRVDWAYEQIKWRILNNRYQPGQQKLENDIAKELGLSRTPVREALIRLQHEGLAEIIPRRGMRVVPIVADDMKEIYEVLTSLECTAAELLAAAKPRPEDLAPMQQAIADMDDALADDNLEGWAAADERFHRGLIDLCGNRRLATLANTIMDQGHRARMVTLKLRPKPDASNDDHRNLLDALLAGDAGTARDIHLSHRQRTRDVLLDILKRYSLPQL